MTADVPELTAHLGYWLRQVSNHVSQAFARKVAAKDVTVAEWAMMRMLYSTQPVAPSQLADEMGMTRVQFPSWRIVSSRSHWLNGKPAPLTGARIVCGLHHKGHTWCLNSLH